MLVVIPIPPRVYHSSGRCAILRRSGEGRDEHVPPPKHVKSPAASLTPDSEEFHWESVTRAEEHAISLNYLPSEQAPHPARRSRCCTDPNSGFPPANTANCVRKHVPTKPAVPLLGSNLRASGLCGDNEWFSPLRHPGTAQNKMILLI